MDDRGNEFSRSCAAGLAIQWGVVYDLVGRHVMVQAEEEGVPGVIAIAADGVGRVVLGWDLACLFQDICLDRRCQ